MKFSSTLSLISLSLTILPVIASQASRASDILRRDDENNVFVGYYDGETFADKTIELERVGSRMMGGANLASTNPRLTSRPVDMTNPRHFDNKQVYYAEIMRGPPGTRCRFLNGVLGADAMSDLKNNPENPNGRWFSYKKPFIPYDGHIVEAMSIFCIASNDGNDNTVDRQVEALPALPGRRIKSAFEDLELERGY